MFDRFMTFKKTEALARRTIQEYYIHFEYLMEFIGDDIKDEVNYKECESFEELQELIGNYIEEYNNDRYQWGLNKMTPAQYRSHLLTS